MSGTGAISPKLIEKYYHSDNLAFKQFLILKGYASADVQMTRRGNWGLVSVVSRQMVKEFVILLI